MLLSIACLVAMVVGIMSAIAAVKEIGKNLLRRDVKGHLLSAAATVDVAAV